MKTFINVAQMKLARLQAGQFVETGGYYTKGDAGQAKYLIVAAQAADGYGDHTLANGTVAVLQISGAINVKNFGAVGDGVTDDTLAIQSAVDRVFSLGGGIVNVPEGTYKTTNYIKLLDNVNIVGEGYASHIHNIATNGFAKVVIASGNVGDPTNGNSMFDEPAFQIESVNKGDFTFTLTNPVDSSRFIVGEIVCIESGEKWNLPFPRDHGKYLHQNLITEVSGDTITLRYAIPDDYPSVLGSRPKVHVLDGVINGYDGTPNFMAKDCGARDLRLTQSIGLTSGWYAIFPSGINQHFENLFMDNCSSLVGSNNLSYSVIRGLQGGFEAGVLDFSEFQNNVLVEDVIAHRIGANPSLNRIGVAANNGSDLTFRNLEVYLGGIGRGASMGYIHRGHIDNCRVYDSGSVGDTTAQEAILLGLGVQCKATNNTIVNQHKHGIYSTSEGSVISGNRVLSTNVGYSGISLPASLDAYTVFGNVLGESGERTLADSVTQLTKRSRNALVYGNDDYYETARKGRVSFAGYSQTSGATLTTLKSTDITGTTSDTNATKGFRVTAIGSRSGVNGAKAVNLKLGTVILSTVNYLAGDNDIWKLEGIINVRPENQSAHCQSQSYLGSTLQDMNYQAVVNGLLSDTTISIDAQCVDAADAVSISQFIVEPIN